MTKRTAQTEKLSLSNPTEPTPTPDPRADAPAPAPAQDGGRVPFETLLTGLPGWQQAALRASTNWPQGREVTQGEFKAALEAATGEVIK